jgi:hypothetical protein
MNLWVAASVRLRRTQAIWRLFEDALGPSPDPADLVIYLRALSGAWSLLFGGSVLLLVGLGFVASAVGGHTGHLVSLTIGVFPMGFCIVGEFDAAWRYKCARRAQQLSSPGMTVDDRAGRLIRMARANDGGVILQLLGGLAASAIALSLG